MEFQKNGKKAKNGVVRQDEQLLINYSGNEHASESDSDRVKPLELPPTRLRRPKSRKIRVSSTTTKTEFSFWNFCQVLFVIVVIGTMVCMAWFTVILKTSLEHMKKRVSILETADRSTSKECADRGKDLTKKVEALRGSTADVITSDEKHFKTLLHKIAVLNKTVESLKVRLKSPESASSIHTDIKLLQTAMADTGREMTEIADKVKQLRKIAHLQSTNVIHLKRQMYNVTVQLAKLAGQPTPGPVVNTATPPWLLRVPADNDDRGHPKISLIEMEKMRKNISAHVRKDMVKIVAYVKKANRSLHSQVHDLRVELSALTKSFAKQKNLIEKLIKKMQNGMSKDNDSVKLGDGNIEQQMTNLTDVMETLTSQFSIHNKKFEELAIDVTSINNTIHKHVKKNGKSPSCNCSLDNILKSIKTDEENIKALQSKVSDIRQSVENLSKKETAPTSPPHSTTLHSTLHPTLSEEKISTPEKKVPATKKLAEPSSVKPKPSTLAQTTSTSEGPSTASSQTQSTSKPTVKEKRTTNQDDDDLDLENENTSDDLPPLSSEFSDRS